MVSLPLHSPHTRARRLIRRYLDPRRAWGAKRDGLLRAHLRDCDDCRGQYDRAVVIHRLSAGAAAEQPTGFESRRMMEAVVETASRPAATRTAPRLQAWVATAAAVALALVIIRPWAPPTVDDDARLRSRGATTAVEAGPRVGIGISGVPAQGGDEYEVVASDRAYLDDYVRFSYTNERADLKYLFVCGIQEGRPLIWYAPLPPAETQSLPIEVERSKQLPFENLLAARHVAGGLKIIALFTREPLTTATIESRLASDLFALAPSDLADAVTARVGLGETAVVQVLETTVAPGHEKEQKYDVH